LPFILTFFLQILENRNSPQIIPVHFYLSLTSLTPTTGAISCSLSPQKPTPASHPLWAFPRAPHPTSSATKLYSHYFLARRHCMFDLMLEKSFRPIMGKTWLDHSSDLSSQAFPNPTQEPYSSPGALEPAVITLYQSHKPRTSWSPFLSTPVDTNSGHTALNPLSSLRNDTSANSTPKGSAFNSLSCLHAPSNSDLAEITWLHFVGCIYNLNSLAQPATPLSTTWKGEIEHESWGIYFPSKFLQFISILRTQNPFQDFPQLSQPKHSNVFATRTAILRSHSEPRDPFCFLCSHWPRHCHHYPQSIGDHYPPSIGDPRLITDPLLKKCRQTEIFKCRSTAYCECGSTENFQLPFNGNFKIAVQRKFSKLPSNIYLQQLSCINTPLNTPG
jgi:hypothetical protein